MYPVQLMSLEAGSKNQIVRIMIPRKDATTDDLEGLGATGILFSAVTVVTMREGAAAPTAVTEVTATVGTYAAANGVGGGFIEVDATNMPGVYEFSVPNAALAPGKKFVDIFFKPTSTAAAQVVLHIDLMRSLTR